MGFGLIIIGIIVLILGLFTPVSNSMTLLISIIFIGYGISRILIKKKKFS
ncbi:hypothetical protein [Ureibacillus manganicus]|nr:hypothetical protein [Ureibacillus manganicus]